MKRYLLISLVVVLLAVAVLGATTAFSQSSGQWQLDFYPNTDWAGYPAYSQTSSTLNFNWGTNPPGANMPNANWTMRASTQTYFYSGTYRFNILADDEVVLVIDNTTYIDTRGKGMSGKNLVIDVPMSEGWHNIRVDLRQFTGAAYLYVSWEYLKPGATPPPGGPTPTPLPWPTPPASAPSVKTQYGDFTPCIQNGSHQSACFQSDGAWNSPNVGSIQMEPKITIWGNCQPADSDYSWLTDPNTNPPTIKDFRCSKTLAGYFPR